ncbi:hypothetical protein NA57DRAFT_50879 [Rhizodiscina lignyota]|uniref:RING-type domain-containing protein n=1 Tax=Rhizodiscina lignyota TaxID=1504668 RepID=A0A9P4IQQ0_9PEZI|nr:hypothetical protein NA57DRAFT_50879 [Rhizodiscina lignyota]
MRPFRLLLTLTCCVLAITFLLYVSVNEPSDAESDHSHSGKSTGLGELFSFHGPLFPPSAIISLTDDNSTFFLARPAAFGPLLPSRGLSGQLWIGSGFAGDAYARDGWEVYAEGELGCSDVPGWNERFGGERGRARLEDEMNRRYRRSTRSKIKEAWRSWRTKAASPEDEEARTPSSIKGDKIIQSLQESAEIAGKIVLLSRGGCGFLEKVEWAQRRGGVAVIVGDNVRGGPIITMYARGDNSNVTIPALFTSRTTAHLLSTLVPKGSAFGPLWPETAGETGAIKGRKSKKLFAHTIEAVEPSEIPSRPSRRGFAKSATARRRSRALYNAVAAWAGISKTKKSQLSRTLSPEVRSDAPNGVDTSFRRYSEDEDWYTRHNGLWVTLTPTNMSSNPFLDTLLVLVVSPLVTLTVVYALLLLRSRMQRRRWRAPKSVVERLPVRTYHTLSSSSSTLATPIASSPTTPLLQSEHRPQPRAPAISEANDFASSSAPRDHHGPIPSDHEKRESGLAEWRRRYGGRQRECVVCLEEYVDGVSRVMSLPCGHEFHAECITPWLTTRRRTCPICKGDVVRSLARHNLTRSRSPSPDAAPSPQHGRRRRRRSSPTDLFRRHADEDSGSEGSVSDEDVQAEALLRRNDSPSAAMPIPAPADAAMRDEEDLERGPESSSAPEARPQTTRSTIWRTVGSWGLPGLGSFGMDGRRVEHASDRDR